ncbi:tellurite resistance TerB family protein [Thalassotalea ganghwensis]
MIKRIKQFLDELSQPPSEESANELSIEMASTVLLCEVMKADGTLAQEEIHHISEQVSLRFTLNKEEVDELIQQAMSTSEHATDFYQFTSKINRHYSAKEKVDMVKHLWLLANSDGDISAIEEHTIRKIADLLHLRRHEYIEAKEVLINL